MKTNLFDKKALAFFGTAAVLLAAVFTAGCKADVNEGGSKSDYATVPFGENGKDLKDYLQKLPDGSTVHKIEVTGLKKEDLIGGAGDASPLGKILKNNSTKKVALKLPKTIDGLTDMSACFYGCTNLVQAPEIPATVTNMNSCFNGCTGLTQVPELPAAVTDMSYCFASCTGLTQSPKIPAAVTNMRFCFYQCTNLTQAPAIPGTVTNMNSCFYQCTGLTQSPQLSAVVTNMGSCFFGCTSLTQTTAIPADVTNMGFCFYDCSKITTVTLKCSYVANKFNSAFMGCSELMVGGIKVPSNQFENYKNNANKMGTTPEKFAAE